MKQSDARLLVVDDDASERRDLIADLNRFGYHDITDFGEWQPALEAAATGRYDLMLLDIDGRGFDGDLVLARVKAMPVRNRVPVIVISGRMGPEQVAHWLQAGSEGNLAKPFQPALLQARINAVLGRQRDRIAERQAIEGRLQGIMDLVADGVAIIDERGAIEAVNTALEASFGYAQQELIGKGAGMLLGSGDRRGLGPVTLAVLTDPNSEHFNRRREMTGKKRSGEEFSMEVAVTALKDSGRRLYAATLRDITERKEADKQIRAHRDQLQRLLEEQIRQRREEARFLEITNALSAELRLEELLASIMRVTTELLGADRSTLFIYDRKTNELWSRVAEGMGTKEIRFPAGAGIAGAAFANREVVNIPDAYADPRFNQEVDRRTGYKTRSILCMPIVNKTGRCIGVTQVLNKFDGPFTEMDIARLKAFTAQAAVSLENAQLFEEVLNMKNYNESILKSLSNGVITLDAAGNIIKANNATLGILNVTEEAILDKPAANLFHDKNAWVLERVGKVVETGEIDLTVDTEFHLESGSAVSVNLAAVPLVDVKDETIGCMLVLEDITSEKRVKSTMSRYMSREVVERLLSGGDSVLGGNAQEVTVLFSDVRKFTTIAEQLGARETVAMLNEYLTEMVDVVLTHGGVLDKYIGDAIMALFGVPFRGENDADNAMAVALDMMASLDKFNARRKELGHNPFDIGIGLNTGEMVAGNIGSPKRMEYTVIGDNVNLAARLESATKQYGVKILTSQMTIDALKKKPISRTVDLVKVRGKSQPVAVYEAIGWPNGADARLQSAIELHEQGIRHFRQRAWSNARACFERALKERPGDMLTEVYLDRIKFCVENPLPDNWDGVWELTEK
jgi:PAS domain S-box-containing protein